MCLASMSQLYAYDSACKNILLGLVIMTCNVSESSKL